MSTNDTIAFLELMAENPALELEWVDLLSQLEYIGCRKILKGVSFERMDVELLRHVSEEALHAYLLKNVVEEGGITHRSWSGGKFSKMGWRYFQTLDHAVSSVTDEAALRYPGVSWAIERRVLEIYPAYLKLTQNPILKRALGQILSQERRHGEQFERVSFPSGYREKVIAIEAPLWEQFKSEVRSAALEIE